jgi:tRNA(fMet)-specific endonuclease VapC
MGVILDTSVLIAAERGIFDVDAFVANREEEPFGLSVITVAELLHGVHRADSRARRIRRNAFVQRVTFNPRDFGKIPGLKVEIPPVHPRA